MVDKRKEISVKSNTGEITKIEAFIEDICDQYNIFNSYFSNILISVVECFEIVVDHIKNAKLEKRKIMISFFAGKNGLNFEINSPIEIFNKKYLDETNKDIDNKIQKRYLVIKYLSDEIHISNEGKLCTITFYISSINYDKSIERNKLLQEYYDKIKITKKV